MIYCCDSCSKLAQNSTNNTTTYSITTTPTLPCIDLNTDFCSFLASHSYCDSLTNNSIMIGNVPFEEYCCHSCLAFRSNSTTISPITLSTTTQLCQDLNSNFCFTNGIFVSLKPNNTLLLYKNSFKIYYLGVSYCRSGVNVRNSATNELYPYIEFCRLTCSQCVP